MRRLLSIQLSIIGFYILIRIADCIRSLILPLTFAWLMKLNTIIRLIISKHIRKLRIWPKILLGILILASANSHCLRRAPVLNTPVKSSNVSCALRYIEFNLIFGYLIALNLIIDANLILLSVNRQAQMSLVLIKRIQIS